MRLRSRGVTLIEALVALALLGLVIGILADLANRYSRLITFARAKDNSALAMAALERMGRECEQSFRVLIPTVGGSADSLEMELIDTDSPLRVQNLTAWEPTRVSDRFLIRYELRDKDLVRVQKSSAGEVQESVLAQEVEGMNIASPDARQVKLELSTREPLKVATFSTVAYRWVR